MFASYLAFQFIDLIAAVLLVLAARRCIPRRLRQRLTDRSPRVLATRFRQLWLVEFPCLVGVALALMLLSRHVIDPLLAGQDSEITVGVLFLAIGAAWYAFFVVVPALGLWFACRERRDRGFAAATVLLATAFLVECMWWGPSRVQVETAYVGIRNWPEGQPPLKVAVLADVQSPLLTARERALPELVQSLTPDLILIPGDLVSGSFDEDLPIEVGRYLANHLSAPLGVIAVNGDVDRGVEGGLGRVLENTPMRLLDNECVPVNEFVEVIGLDPHFEDEYQDALTAPTDRPVRLGIVHRPRHARDLARVGCDLIVAGHTHGGQMVLPGFGPPVTLSPLPRDIAAGGLFALGGRAHLYISRGIGMEAGFAPPMRLFCPPEVSLLTLGPAGPAPRAPAQPVQDVPISASVGH